MVIVCSACGNTVLPKRDKTCPTCGENTQGSPKAVLPENSLSSEEYWVAQELHAQERQKERARQKARSGAKLSAWIGGALVLFGMTASILSYLSTEPGGSYSVWFGSMIGGFVILARGMIYAQE